MSTLTEIMVLRSKVAAYTRVPLLVLSVVLGAQVVGGAVTLPTYLVVRWLMGPSESLTVICWMLFFVGASFGGLPLYYSASQLHAARCRIADLENRLGDE